MAARLLTVLWLAPPSTSSVDVAINLDNAVLVQVRADHAPSGNTGSQENTADKAEQWAAFCVEEGKRYTEFMQWVAEMVEHSRIMADKWFENSFEWRNLAVSALLLSTQPGVDLTADREGLARLKGNIEKAARTERTGGLLDDVKKWMDNHVRQGTMPADFTAWLQSMSKSVSAVARKWLRSNLEWQGTAAGSLLAVSPGSAEGAAGALQEKVEKALEFFDERTRDDSEATFSLAGDAVKAFAEELADTVEESVVAASTPASSLAEAAQPTQLRQEAYKSTREQLADDFSRGVKSMAENSLEIVREWFERSEEFQKLFAGSSLRLTERTGDVEVATAGGDPNIPIMRETLAKAIMIMDQKAKGDGQVLDNITRTINRAALNSFANTLDKGVQRIVHHQAQKHERRMEAVRDFAHEVASNIKTLATQYGKEQKLFWDTIEVVKKTTEGSAAVSRHWLEKHLHWQILSPSNMERILKGQRPLRELQWQ